MELMLEIFFRALTPSVIGAVILGIVMYLLLAKENGHWPYNKTPTKKLEKQISKA